MWTTMGNLASRASDGSDLYAFVTAGSGGRYGGWAPVGSLCGGKSRSVSITRYQGRASGTAWVNIKMISVFSKWLKSSIND